MIPGGGFGIFNGCASNSGDGEPANGPAQFSTPYSNWGARYGGVQQKSACSGLPNQLKDACEWRFDDFQNADNPGVSYTRVDCPPQLTQKSKCKLCTDPNSGGGNPAPAPTPAPGGPCTLQEGDQCYGKPGSGSACGGTDGYCGICCLGLKCGGTLQDNEWWKGCRPKKSVGEEARNQSTFPTEPSQAYNTHMKQAVLFVAISMISIHALFW